MLRRSTLVAVVVLGFAALAIAVGGPSTTLVSVNSAGTASGNSDSESAAMSANGRFVAFASNASDLVSNDTNFATDAFVRNLK